MIRLRGHHLVCLHFYHGEGYQPDFVAHLTEILDRAEKGELIEVVSGPDDVCVRCPFLSSGSCMYKEDADEGIREMDRAAHELHGVRTGEVLHWRRLSENLPRLFRIWSEKYCRGCDWREACGKDAAYRDISAEGLP